MPVDLVRENEYGAYLGVTPKLSSIFRCLEENPNFDVCDQGSVRLIVAKCSRIADDENPQAGRYGIDFHRAKPVFDGKSGLTYQKAGKTLPVNARSYAEELPDSLKNTAFTGNIAFAAKTEGEYRRKAQAYEGFYHHIFTPEPRTIYVAPHSGNISREPDDVQPNPRFNIDSWTAGAAALCALKDEGKPGRNMVSIHGNGYMGAIMDVGDFGILDSRRLRYAVDKVGRRYHQKVRPLSEELKWGLLDRCMKKIEHIQQTRGTLNPRELQFLSTVDKSSVDNITRCLRQYGQKIEDYTLDEFERAMSEFLKGDQVKGLAINQIFSGRKTGRLLRLHRMMESGLLDGAIQIECSEPYLEKEPELMADIIVDIRRELFGP